MYLGNAFYMYVGQVMTGISWAVLDDREHYRTLKYIYVAPIHIPSYLLGRGIASFIVATISVVITLVVGVLFLNVNIELLAVNWGLFFLSLFIGVIMLAMMGLILAGVTLMLANHGWFIGDATAGALYLFSGAIFPLDVLPVFLRPIGYVMPITYWLELLRRSLVSSVSEVFPTLANFTNVELLGILIGLTAVFAVIAAVVFYWCDHQARERGMIDMVTNY
jgi:ABC-2 type transport system permease protein